MAGLTELATERALQKAAGMYKQKKEAASGSIARFEQKTKEIQARIAKRAERKARMSKIRKAMVPRPLSQIYKAEKTAKTVSLRQRAGKVFRAGLRALGGTERALERQIAMGGRRGGLGLALKGTSVFSKVGGPIGMAGDLLAVGMAGYTGAKAYGAHKELQRKKKYAEEKYGTVAKAIKTRKERTGR
jgi:hypothetical protein